VERLQSFTVAQAMDERPICSDSSWEEYEDDRGRIIVEYACNLNGAESYFSESGDEVDQYLSQSLGYRIKQQQKYISQKQSKVKAAPELINQVIEKFKANGELDDFAFVEYRVSPLRDCDVATSSYSDGYSEEKAADLRSCLEERVSNDKADLDRRASEIEEMQGRMRNKSKVTGVSSATEIFRWTVTEESIYYHGGGISLTLADSSDLYFPYMEDGGRYGYSMKQALSDTLNNEMTDYATLASSRNAVPGVSEVMSRL
tara:strand:- start:1849 stop:2625 length:777 start_codon:yes stop_codon:yes gene_type:complete